MRNLQNYLYNIFTAQEKKHKWFILPMIFIYQENVESKGAYCQNEGAKENKKEGNRATYVLNFKFMLLDLSPTPFCPPIPLILTMLLLISLLRSLCLVFKNDRGFTLSIFLVSQSFTFSRMILNEDIII